MTLYFSDGSITYLDGMGSLTGAVLRLLPHSAVEKNDEDGIITKIRLKLTSGKIWNKVVRLAEKSEFNVETTSAIAGVRGTEFGIDATGTELIVLSGRVAARQIDSTLMGTGADYLDLDYMTVFGNNQVAVGDGTLSNAVFDIPEGTNEISTKGTPAGTADMNRITNYYHLPYNNNLAPRILELNIPDKILSLKLFEKGQNNPFENNPPNAIIVFDENGEPLQTWYTANFQVDTAIASVTVNQDKADALFSDYPSKKVTFAYKDEKGNLSAKSTPPVLLSPDTSLTYAMLYGDWEEEVGTGGQQGNKPVITSWPTSVTLIPEYSFNAEKPCNWSLSPATGGLFTSTPQNVDTVYYRALDDQQTVEWRIDAVQSRFSGNGTEEITVRCTDPNDDTLYDEKLLTIIYEPFDKSTASGYEYSWFAKGATNWYAAKATCGGWNALTAIEQSEFSNAGLTPSEYPGLKEGGVLAGTWRLPTRLVYDSDDVAPPAGDNKTSLTELAYWCDWDTVDLRCKKMPTGVNKIWLLESQDTENGWSAPGYGITMGSKLKVDQESEIGFRCVK